jgi:hypothetical protein
MPTLTERVNALFRRTPKQLQREMDKVLAVESQSVDATPSSFHPPTYAGQPPQYPIGSVDAGGASGARLAPVRAVPEPTPMEQEIRPEEKTATYGVSGTPITSAFLLDLGEYNPKLIGRYAVPVWEQMRRGDDMVWAVLDVCRRPVQTANWRVVAGEAGRNGNSVASTGAGKGTQSKAEEVRKFVEDNLFGGLETQTSMGSWSSQSWASVIYNASLMLDFGVSIHEDVWHVDGDRLRLRALPGRQALTFWRWHTEADGETLYALEQYGYRGNAFLNVTLPSDKFCRFTHRQEGANFFGIALTRAFYSAWFFKDRLKRIGGVAAERNLMGIPMWRLSTKDASDKSAADAFVKSVVAHEATGGVEPPLPSGVTDAQSGFRFVTCNTAGENLKALLEMITYYDLCMARAALAMFLQAGQMAHGTRATTKEHTDFFMLAVQSIADQIAWEIQMSTVRRLVWYNFGTEAPMPELQVANVQARQVEEFADLIQKLAQAGSFVSDQGARDMIREMMAMPKETRDGIVTLRGETITEGEAGPGTIGGKFGQPEEQTMREEPLFHWLPADCPDAIMKLKTGDEFKLTSPVAFTEDCCPYPGLVVLGALSSNPKGQAQYLKGRFRVRQGLHLGESKSQIRGYILADQLSTDI